MYKETQYKYYANKAFSWFANIFRGQYWRDLFGVTSLILIKPIVGITNIVPTNLVVVKSVFFN